MEQIAADGNDERNDERQRQTKVADARQRRGDYAVIMRQRYSWCRGILSGFPTISLRERLSVLLIGQLHTRF